MVGQQERTTVDRRPGVLNTDNMKQVPRLSSASRLFCGTRCHFLPALIHLNRSAYHRCPAVTLHHFFLYTINLSPSSSRSSVKPLHRNNLLQQVLSRNNVLIQYEIIVILRWGQFFLRSIRHYSNFVCKNVLSVHLIALYILNS